MTKTGASGWPAGIGTTAALELRTRSVNTEHAAQDAASCV
jgi:hypothetical protein